MYCTVLNHCLKYILLSKVIVTKHILVGLEFGNRLKLGKGVAVAQWIACWSFNHRVTGFIPKFSLVYNPRFHLHDLVVSGELNPNTHAILS